MPTSPDPEMPVPVNLLELEALAAAKLDPAVYDYFRSGAGAELTLARNRAAFAELALLPRVLVDVSEVDLATTALGTELAHPIVVAPTAFHRLADPEGEIATARGAAAAEAVFCLSSLSNTPLGEVAAAADARRWFQLYVFRDRGVTRDLVERAEAAGYGAIVLTVDAPILGRRERDVRNGFHLPPGIEAVNLLASGHRRVDPVAGDSGLSAYVGTLIEPGLSWADLEWLRGITRLPVLIKGVVRADDAARAVEHGVAGVVVSNHGGRQLDSSPATAEVLPRVVDAVAGRAEVLVDGGVRRGTDVVKALAMGARAVLLGRPVLWGLTLGGQAGVARALELLRVELDEALALSGCKSPAEATRDLLSGGAP